MSLWQLLHLIILHNRGRSFSKWYAQCCQFSLDCLFLIVPSVFSNVYCFCVFNNDLTPPSPSRAFLFVTRYEQCRYVARSIGIVTNTHFIRWRKREYPNKTTFYNKWQIWLSSFRYNLIIFAELALNNNQSLNIMKYIFCILFNKYKI